MLCIFMQAYVFAQCTIDYSRYHKVLDEDFTSYSLNRAVQIAQLKHSRLWIFNDNNDGGCWNSIIDQFPRDQNDPSMVQILEDPSGVRYCELSAVKFPSLDSVVRNHNYYATNGCYVHNWRYYNSGMLYLKRDFESIVDGVHYFSDPIPSSGDCADGSYGGFKYGIMEIVCKINAADPHTWNTWPAFWGHGAGPSEMDIIDNGDTDKITHFWGFNIIDWGMYPGWHQSWNPWIHQYGIHSTGGHYTDTFLLRLDYPSATAYNTKAIYPTVSHVFLNNGATYDVYVNGITAYPPSSGMNFFVNNTVNMSTEYHKYSIGWDPDKITFFFDGVEVGTKRFDVQKITLPCLINLIADLQIQGRDTLISHGALTLYVTSMLTISGG